ncbi:MAG: hypothetical protein LBG22_11680 [Treponema sp.]|nr:hypothetical protein [Treponema sp.]
MATIVLELPDILVDKAKEEGLLIVLDTHIFVWMNLEPDRIPAEIQSAMNAETVFGIPAISLWEIAMLTGKGRLAITE